MYFDSFQAVLAMNGHGVYVWTAYFVTIVMIAIILIVPIVRRRRFLRQLAAQLKRAQGAPVNSAPGES